MLSTTNFVVLAGLLAKFTSAQITTSACCTKSTDCYLVEGVTESGLKWCYGYGKGEAVFDAAKADVAKCITDLHTTQDTKRISQEGSPCDAGVVDLVRVQSEFLSGPYTLSEDSAQAIKSAMDYAAGDPEFLWSESLNDGPGYPVFAHVAENGSGIEALSISYDQGC